MCRSTPCSVSEVKTGFPDRSITPPQANWTEAYSSIGKQYDLTRYVLRNWRKLRKDLSGKLLISVGHEDNAFLNISAQLIEQKMKKIGADIRFEYYPGNHFTVATREYRRDEDTWLKTTYLRWLATSKP